MALTTGYIFDSNWNKSGYWIPFYAEIASILFYFMLYFYLNEIVPNQYGIQRHPLFCFMRSEEEIRVKKLKKKFSNLDLNQPLVFDSEIGDYSSSRFHQPFKNPKKLNQVIKVNNLKKYYDGENIKAVDDISF